MVKQRKEQIKKILFDWDEIKPQFEEKDQKIMEHIIWMAKSTGEPQKAVFELSGLEFAVWPSGKISKLAEEKECLECQGKGSILKQKEIQFTNKL